MILKVAGVAFRYNSHAILKGIDFELAPGEILTVLGPNGVGKTTLLKCINAIHRPVAGAVYVEGKDILALSTMEVARKVGYVAQRIEPSRVTAFDAVLMGRRPHVCWGVSGHDLETVSAALKRLGLTDLSLRYLNQMSGGELQKVAIARALVQDPRIMLLDEPTSSLDLKNQVEIMDLIRGVASRHRLAVVMTMHDLNTAFHYADKCIFLKDGKIFFAGSPLEVDAGIIEAVYGLPIDIHRQNGRLLVVPKSIPATEDNFLGTAMEAYSPTLLSLPVRKNERSIL